MGQLLLLFMATCNARGDDWMQPTGEAGRKAAAVGDSQAAAAAVKPRPAQARLRGCNRCCQSQGADPACRSSLAARSAALAAFASRFAHLRLCPSQQRQ